MVASPLREVTFLCGIEYLFAVRESSPTSTMCGALSPDVKPPVYGPLLCRVSGTGGRMLSA